MGLEVRILGPLEVSHGNRPVVVRGAKERALVVRLAVDAGRVVSFERLVASLWDGEPPASADSSLRVLVSRVRKALAEAGADDVLVTRPPGYVLVADEVDAARFELLARRGLAELAEGRAVDAAATLAQALGLWRGDRLGEVASDELRTEADRLQETRLAALEGRIEADLACGRHAEMLGELEALCRRHPLREGLWALWITALYRSDRQADALAAYQDLRRVLAEELGIDPSPRLRALEAAVLAQDPVLASPRDAVHTDSLSGVAFPAALDVVERAPLVGRDEELRAARAAWTAVAEGAPGVVLVPGDAGVGKTRLVRELARGVHARGAVVLYGRCDEDLAIPYRPFVECLSHLVADVPDEVLSGVDARTLGELTRLVSDLALRRPGLPAPQPADPQVERYLLFGAVAGVLGALARSGPALVIVDDLHWADRPTLLLLRHLAGLAIPRMLLVGTFRRPVHTEGALVEALGALQREAVVTRIAPRALTTSETATVLGATAAPGRGGTDDDLAGFLQRQTGGNPFYLVEMLSHLRETGILDAADGRHANAERAAVGLPDSIRDVLRSRLARLGEKTALVLSEAAVIGQEFDVDVLATSAGVQVDDVLDRLDVASRAALVDEPGPPGRFRFTHALVQQTLYGDLGPTRRTRTHARVAAAMQAVGGRQPGELAFHALAGITPQTTMEAVRHARAAGAAALAASAPDEAVRWYTAALNALPPPRDDVEHARALVDLGGAQRLAGQPAYRETLFAAARLAQRNGADDVLVDAALASSRGTFSSLGEVDDEKVALLQAAVAVTPSDSPERARLLAVLASELMWHPDYHRRIAVAQEAVAVARRTGDSATLLFAILHRGPAAPVPETIDEHVALLREAVVLAERADDRVAWADAIVGLASVLVSAASPERLDDELDAAAAVFTQIGEPWSRIITHIVRGCLASLHGDLDRAETDLAVALDIGQESGQPDALAMNEEALSLVRWHQGRLAEMLPRLRASAAAKPETMTFGVRLALAEAEFGDPQAARALLDAAAARNFDMLYGLAWLGAMCQWAYVAAELDDVRAGATLYARLAPWPHLFAKIGPVPIFAVSLALGRLAALRGQVDVAESHFAQAQQVHEAVESPFGSVLTALHWGRLLLARDPDRARHLLATATALADRHGFVDVARRARDVLTAA
jgi:DNA-binding SARP family transcriptional activator